MDLSKKSSAIQITSGEEDDWDPKFLPQSNVIVFGSAGKNEPYMYLLCPFGEIPITK